ncbi:hypothetical protein SUDANB176_00314 [Streptomyces sp. enrichment culture]
MNFRVGNHAIVHGPCEKTATVSRAGLHVVGAFIRSAR